MSNQDPSRPDLLKLAVERGFQQGKSIRFGVFTTDVDQAALLPDAARAELREQAAAELAVIDAAERARRTLIGRAGAAVTTAVAMGLLATQAPLLSRAALVFPIWLFAGYIDSGRTGLWQIAQAGTWDVDGSGIQPIGDMQLAARIRERVNSFNKDGVVKAAAITAALVILPELVGLARGGH